MEGFGLRIWGLEFNQVSWQAPTKTFLSASARSSSKVPKRVSLKASEGLNRPRPEKTYFFRVPYYTFYI